MAAIAERYDAQVAAGQIETDPAQRALVDRLARLEKELKTYRQHAKSSALGWLMAGAAIEAPRGLYIWGEVGRGKTMLMDMFCEVAPSARKRRAHFHEFMLDVHDRVQAFRAALKRGEIADEDPIRLAGAAIASETTLLCFDEFHVTDIADAMILGRLFEKMLEQGVVLVATSNVPPSDLYKDGLNRALFVPFITMLESRLDVVRLAARTDFRSEKLEGVESWHVPADRRAAAAVDAVWRRLAGPDGGAPTELRFKGRSIRVPKAGGGAARFRFADLRGAALGAADYVRLARTFHTIVLEEVPILGGDQHDEAKRLILLIDALYDNRVKLIATAAAPPEQIYAAESGFEAFEFRRTASRLREMRSTEYRALPHGRGGARELHDPTGLVET